MQQMLKLAADLTLTEQGPRPILLGRHLLPRGILPGPRMGQILQKAYEAVSPGAAGSWSLSNLGPRIIANNFDLLDVTLDHVTGVETLPYHHRDPFDRVIVALAQAHGFTVLTSDENIRKYAGVNTLW